MKTLAKKTILLEATYSVLPSINRNNFVARNSLQWEGSRFLEFVRMNNQV
jgi:hypothetical protein